MWGAFVALFRFFSVTLLNSCYFVLDYLHLAMAWLSSFFVPINIPFVLDNLYLVVLAPLFTFLAFQIKNFLWDQIKNFLKSILTVGSNVKGLTDEFDKLKQTLEDVEHRIRIETNGGVMKKTTEEVEGWMKRVKDLEPTVESVKADYNNRSYFSNIYSISTRAVNTLKMVREEAKFTNGGKTYTIAVSPPSVQQMSADPIEFGREMFELRLQEALNFLRDDKKGVLGIWGMGGVGKTTLLEHINDTIEKNPSSFGFDKVVFVTASRESTTLNIQKELMKRLGLPAPEGGDDRTNIFNYLCNKSFLLLLDDLWEDQGLKDLKELKKVGVPLPLGIVGEHKLKRKLILTTRSLRVCSKMGRQVHTINVECLGTEDARLLFRYNAGVDAAMIQSNPWIEEFADKVADECNGLPIALITTGHALAETETVQVWQNSLRLLKESKLSKIPGMDDPLPLLKVSYDHLTDPMEKECLLHCALWPEDALIRKDELIQCWMGHGLLGESGSIQDAYNTGHAIIDSLVKVCLLENPKVLDWSMFKNDRVKLHDVIRDMALWIVRGCGVDNDNKWVVLSGSCETAPPDKRTWSEVQKMTLMHPDLSLSNWPFRIQNFPNLTTLIINGFWQKMDMSFLKHLNALKYLDLSSCLGIKKFPIEICGLNKLEFLNLSDVDIGSSLPEDLKNLKNLKHLLLQNAGVSTVPAELLSNLVSLRELDLFDVRSQSSIIDRLDFQEGCLDSLGINVSSVLHFQKLTQLPSIFIRALCIQEMEDWTSPSLDLLSTKFLGSHNIQFSLKRLDIEQLAGSIEELVIEEKCRLTSLDHRPLDYLRISHCGGLKGIMLWKGVEVFPNLRSLYIFDCHQLKIVAGIANLSCLERAELWDCKSMEQLVIWEQGREVEESGRIFFPSLRILSLRNLPKLSSICDFAVTFRSLEYLIVDSCPQLMKLSFQSNASCPNLKTITVQKSWWDGTLQLDGDMRAFLDPLCDFSTYASSEDEDLEFEEEDDQDTENDDREFEEEDEQDTEDYDREFEEEDDQDTEDDDKNEELHTEAG